jgi:uncharacterized protein (TIGR02453 family)
MAQVLTCPGPTKSFLGFCPQGIALLRPQKGRRNKLLPAEQEMYEYKIANPLLELVCSVTREFARFAPNYVTPPERAVFPIFGARASRVESHNQRPGAIWVHRNAKGARGACFYFHFTSREAVVLGGVYAPAPLELSLYRKLLQQRYKEFQDILRDRRLKTLTGGLEGEKLKSLPKGISRNHPAADLLRRRQWYVCAMLDMALLSTTQLLPTLVKHFETMAPFVEFLNLALPQPRRKPLLRSFASGDLSEESRV